ncbi:MAG: L-erythro-3,5-diaminohexanoate dehydrogenase [Bacteriovoracia bacterium]
MRKSGDRFGTHRVVSPVGVLPQQAEKLDTALPIYENELLIDVDCLNIDSASFHQIKEVCGADPLKMQNHFLEIIQKRGKQHNPVTGSGGMLIGRVKEVGPKFLEGRPKEDVITEGDKIATLVSLTLTPLYLAKITKVHLDTDKLDVSGHAILFQSGIYAKLPNDISETEALAILDVAAAPAQTAAMCKKGQTVVVIGAGGKSGMLCCYEAKKKVGPTGRVIGLDYGQAALELMKKLSFIDASEFCDARDAVKTHQTVKRLSNGELADICINTANIPDTEMACVLSVKPGGTAYFFNMATSFTKATLGSEGVGSDATLIMGNGYRPGHAEYALNILRQSKEIREIFRSKYGAS